MTAEALIVAAITADLIDEAEAWEAVDDLIGEYDPGPHELLVAAAVLFSRLTDDVETLLAVDRTQTVANLGTWAAAQRT